ncbi:hypothetical protein FACS1894199_06300 [Bacteroidia bacterium]|nr:hypothetical protein FACS1894199_06300 [Bacteroidia bacterium]
MNFHDNGLILNKYNITYHICPTCGFIQTEHPYWVDESYSNAIAAADTGCIFRNLSNSADLLFLMKFIENTLCLDFGGGHGVLTRIMRDYGFNFEHYDKYAENLFANGFEGSLEQKYNLITSFENFEHFVNPMEEIEKLINITDVLYFSTEIIPANNPKINDWWYYVPSTGQHISFYSIKTLQYIANKYKLYFYTNSHSIHIFSKKPIAKAFFFYLRIYNKICRMNLQKYFKNESKTWEDMNKIISSTN